MIFEALQSFLECFANHHRYHVSWQKGWEAQHWKKLLPLAFREHIATFFYYPKKKINRKFIPTRKQWHLVVGAAATTSERKVVGEHQQQPRRKARSGSAVRPKVLRWNIRRTAGATMACLIWCLASPEEMMYARESCISRTNCFKRRYHISKQIK